MNKAFKFFVAAFVSVGIAAVLIYVYNINYMQEKAPVSSEIKEAKVLVQQDATIEPANIPEETAPALQTQVQEVKKEPLRIVAVGDILLGRGVSKKLADLKKPYTYPFEKVADLLKRGDIVYGNLEEPITSSTKGLTGIKQGGKFVLKNDIQAFEGIKYAGFNLLGLANNHIMDYYEKGLQDTIDILDKNGIAHTGAAMNITDARKLAILDKKSQKIGMLSYTDMADIIYKGTPKLKFRAEDNKSGVSPIEYDFSVKPSKYNYEFMKKEIDRVRSSVDILIIAFHWGVEESFDVTPEQAKFARFLIDSGADIILGTHPHQYQGIEIYKGKPIVYSMGNFIFDQNDPENQESFILEMEYLDKKLNSLSLTPVRTINKSQVVPQSGISAKEMLERQVLLSEKLNTQCRIEGDKIVYQIDN